MPNMKALSRAAALCAVATLLSASTPALAQAPMKKLSLESYLDMESVSNPQISPDGRQIVYTRGWVDKLNDSRESIGAALKYLGYSINTTDEALLEEAKQVLLAIKPYLYAYDSDQFEDLLVSGEVVYGHGYSGDYFAAAVEDERIWYVIPKEGGVIWADNLCIPASSKNKYSAELFINYVLQPEIAAQITNFTWYASPVEVANPFINPEILEEPAIYPSPETFERLEWIQDVGDATPLFERIWTEVKAAGQ